MRCRAALLVRAATELTRLFAWSIRDDTRRGGQSDSRAEQRDYNRARNRHPAKHEHTDSMIVTGHRGNFLTTLWIQGANFSQFVCRSREDSINSTGIR